MTDKMKLIFVITVIISTIFVVLSTPFALDFSGHVLSAFTRALGLHQEHAPSPLAILSIPGLLYLVFRQRKHS